MNTPQELLTYFSSLSPDFAAVWRDEGNLNISESGFFSLAGVCAEYSTHFISQSMFVVPKLTEAASHPTMTDDLMQRLFEFIEAQVSNRRERTNELAGALLTCFVENIAQTPAGDYARKFMGSSTQAYFDKWHVSPSQHDGELEPTKS